MDSNMSIHNLYVGRGSSLDTAATATDVPVVNAPVVNAPVVDVPVVNAPHVVNTPVVNAPVVNAPVVNAPVVNALVVEKTAIVDVPVLKKRHRDLMTLESSPMKKANLGPRVSIFSTAEGLGLRLSVFGADDVKVRGRKFSTIEHCLQFFRWYYVALIAECVNNIPLMKQARSICDLIKLAHTPIMARKIGNMSPVNESFVSFDKKMLNAEQGRIMFEALESRFERHPGKNLAVPTTSPFFITNQCGYAPRAHYPDLMEECLKLPKDTEFIYINETDHEFGCTIDEKTNNIVGRNLMGKMISVLVNTARAKIV
jgi:hypothetical protein